MTRSPESQALKKRRVDTPQYDWNAKMKKTHSTDKNGVVGHSKEDIDTSLYSRQIGTYGLEAMKKLMGLKVLISGLAGIGVECAKNLILAGPSTVILHDNNVVQPEDLATNFFCSDEDINVKTRAEACVTSLANLNHYVQVSVSSGSLTKDFISTFDVVMISDSTLDELERINSICHSNSPPIGFITADTFGLMASVFVDFGECFTVFDKDGEEPKSVLIASISQAKKATVLCHQDKIIPFETGDYVNFQEVQGMIEINSQPPMSIQMNGKTSFTIGDTTSFSPYTREGVATQVKMPLKLKFKSFGDSLRDPLSPEIPNLMTMDLSKFGRSEQLHFAYRAIQLYKTKNGCLPSVRDQKAIAACIQNAKQMNDEAKSNKAHLTVDEIDEKVIEFACAYARCQITPITTFIGGIVAQEIVKYTGKYHPLLQWLHFDAFELAPNDIPAMCSPRGCRYDHHIQIWGEAFQKKLSNAHIFLVGAGALGCEYLKQFALLGIGCDLGQIMITDNDRIETSNLNRQFLFHREHIGLSKSKVAAAEALAMNSKLQIQPLETRVGTETEDVFNDKFWERLDLVVNALDNVPSRLYIDGRCIWYEKPLLESGTLGLKANVQVVIPHITEAYSDSQDPPEQSIPLCTLKHFPNAIEHTIQWARDAFEGLFTETPRQALSYLNDTKAFLKRIEAEQSISVQREQLEQIRNLLFQASWTPESLYINCIRRACEIFHDFFYLRILQLLSNFPIDHVTSNGSPFWSGPKRPPTPISLNIEDPLIYNFIQATSNILADNLGLRYCYDEAYIKAVVQTIKLQEFKAKSVVIKVDENDTSQEGACDDEEARQVLIKELSSIGKIPIKFVPSTFEKDDDTNFHIQFIHCCANLRARNYKIQECDRHKAKMIAGNIIPAVATTTAMITGLTGIELLKYLLFKDQNLTIELFKNAFANLSLPLWLLSEPLPPRKTLNTDYDPVTNGPVWARPLGFTTWNKIKVFIEQGTLQQLIDWLAKEYEVEVSILSVGNSCLYNSFLPAHKKNRLHKPINQIVEEITKEKLIQNRNYVVIESSCVDLNDATDVVIPTIKYQFMH